MSLRDLVEGMNGEDVRALQQGFNAYFGDSREALDPDGKFGTKTRAALDAFQSANPGTGHLDGTPDGVAGQRTRRKLFPLAVYTVSAVAYRQCSSPPRIPIIRCIRPGSTRDGCTLGRPSRWGNHSSSGSRPSRGLTYSRSTGPRSCKTRRSITPPSVSSTFPRRWSLRRS